MAVQYFVKQFCAGTNYVLSINLDIYRDGENPPPSPSTKPLQAIIKHSPNIK
jgi:hypothetical protein